MEKIKTETAAAPAATEAATKLRAATREGCCQHQSLFSEEKLRGEPVPVEVEKQMRKVAYGKLMQIAGSYGLGFNEQELDAFYRLSLATNPNVAMHAAQVACKDFLGKWEN